MIELAEDALGCHIITMSGREPLYANAYDSVTMNCVLHVVR